MDVTSEATTITSTEVSIRYSSEIVEAQTFRYWPFSTWIPTSMKALEYAESRLLKGIEHLLRGRYVPVRAGQGQLWTVSLQPPVKTAVETNNKSFPLVLIHGFGGGVGLWIRNLEPLAKERPVHAFDLLGFGRSSRPQFSSDPALVEMEWVESIEDWRKDMKLEQFVLLGHSLGGYLAAAYALEYPDRVRHLILADPWGFPPKPPEDQMHFRIPGWVKVAAKLLGAFNPLSTLRAIGPFGPGLVRRVRPDLGNKFASLDDGDSVYDYIYHCNAQTPSGEIAFKSISESFGWAKRPMLDRIGQLPTDIPVSFIYGSRTWMDQAAGYKVANEIRVDSYVNVEVIKGAGHHVYADKPEDFNEVTRKILSMVDSNEDCGVMEEEDSVEI